MTISNNTVNGNSTGGNIVGGLLGNIETNDNITLIISKCTNNGDVNGTYSCVGGLIGAINNNDDLTFVVSESVNNGIVLMIGTSNADVGGFIGSVSTKQDTFIMVSDCANNGVASGENYAGGFAGDILVSVNTTITISNWTNNGDITADRNAGGFVGDMSGEKSSLTISNSINNGNIEGSSLCAGGLFGLFFGSNMNVTLSNNTNNGDLSGGSYAGGFIALIVFYSQEPQPITTTFDIINNANKGRKTATGGMACGLFCVDLEYSRDMDTTVMNSINKGIVNGSSSAYGITNNVTKARNVVSMGKVICESEAYGFWNASTDVDMAYGLNGICENFGVNTTLFHHNDETGDFQVDETGEHVHDLLNNESQKQSYGMYWTKELELVSHLDIPSSSSTTESESNNSIDPSTRDLSSGVFHSLSMFLLVFILFTSLF